MVLRGRGEGGPGKSHGQGHAMQWRKIDQGEQVHGRRGWLREGVCGGDRRAL